MDDPAPAGEWVRRHRLATRLWHWANAAVLVAMLMSGLMIFNAHPRLYWGEHGANFDAAWLQIGAIGDRGAVSVGGRVFDTTGVLGVSAGPDGMPVALAFPGWATIPSTYDLAAARLWHLGLAPVIVGLWAAYQAWSIASGHLRRDLWPKDGEWKPAHIARDVLDHLRLRFGSGARYNILQKLAYLGVLLLLLPLVMVTGLAMAPGMDAAWPWLTEVFRGRQTARSIHFLCAFGLVAFFIVHVVMVVLAGPLREMRAMVTGWWRVRP